uniref:hypothetical protein n=1 Tax=Eubacterium sp. TaxID=142586 RepID=UPI003FEF3537
MLFVNSFSDEKFNMKPPDFIAASYHLPKRCTRKSTATLKITVDLWWSIGGSNP